MTIAYLCVLIAAVIPYICAGYAKFSGKGYDNSKPREFLETLEGKRRHAHYAQLNGFEAFPAFAAAVIIAYIAGVSPDRITPLAVSFVVFRIFYSLAYIFDKSSLRTLVWFGGFLSVLSLFILAMTRT